MFFHFCYNINAVLLSLAARWPQVGDSNGLAGLLGKIMLPGLAVATVILFGLALVRAALLRGRLCSWAARSERRLAAALLAVIQSE